MTPPEPKGSLLVRMQSCQSRLPAALAKVGAWALAYPFRTATLKIGELAAAAEVSVASVNRYARVLGYDGFPDFREDLLRAFESTFAPVEKLRVAVQRDTTNAEIMRESLAGDADNIARTLELLQPEQCEAAIRLIREARRIVALGLGDSAFLALFLVDVLEPYVDNAREAIGFGGTERNIRRLLTIKPGDLVVAITSPRYSRGTIEHLRLARERGAKAIALTDAPDSPIVPLADVTLLARADHGVRHSSPTGLMALIVALGTALSRSGPDSIGQAADVAEHLLPYLHVVPKSGPGSET
ncbi:MurR/RpiR family transcriptional regulator [Azospirillum sp. ST 5-10]|uniref:MurR/RpiR family transcriptional regulator n=1 Tax=unclassified Azospirillum TaxID=2630922 RepID=UPI003F4A5C84